MTIPALLLYMYVAGMFYDAEYMSLFGIKTKWTLDSPTVWEKTNRLASRLFRISAALMLVPVYFYRLFYIFLAVPPVISFIAATIYSKVISGGGGSDSDGDDDSGDNGDNKDDDNNI